MSDNRVDFEKRWADRFVYEHCKQNGLSTSKAVFTQSIDDGRIYNHQLFSGSELILNEDVDYVTMDRIVDEYGLNGFKQVFVGRYKDWRVRTPGSW